MSDSGIPEVRNAIVVGSGPAGYTAAIYLARAALEPVVSEGSVTAGGALMNTTDVENYPGFPDGVMGPQLMDDLRRQAQRFGAEPVTDDVTEMDLAVDPKVVKVGETTYYAKTVVLAMGSVYRNLDVPGESELSGRGVSRCATCDGFFFRDQDIVVVGGGDSAVEEATFLTRFARSVTMVHRRGSLRASKIMQERAFSNDKIRFEWDSEVVEAVGTDRLEGVRLRNRRSGEERLLAATGLFVASVMTRAPSWSRARWSWTMRATLSSSGCIRRRPTCPASSRPATWSTTLAGRPSPRPHLASRTPRWHRRRQDQPLTGRRCHRGSGYPDPDSCEE